MTDLIWLDWPAPDNIKACSTLRESGVSKPPFDTFNLATHVGDDAECVFKNRQCLSDAIGQTKFHWLEQIHGTQVVNVAQPYNAKADASFSREPGQVCCVMTADCLPVFFCDNEGQQVAIAHAGWRGLCEGILQNVLSKFHYSRSVMAFLGPAISQTAFEVGDDVRDAFMSHYKNLDMAKHFTSGDKPNKWMGDLYGLATTLLNDQGVHNIYGGDCCTFLESDHYFSYRRDNITGRMAHLIWLE